MPTLVLLRHGESTWNLENRFTGWTDVGLTDTGVQQAQEAGRLLKQSGFEFDIAYTSVLKRAIWTLWHALDEMERTWLPVVNDWRLNERHYGALQGLNKADMARQYGEQQVLIWRRSYDTPPPALQASDPRGERSDPRYASLAAGQVPRLTGAAVAPGAMTPLCAPVSVRTVAPVVASTTVSVMPCAPLAEATVPWLRIATVNVTVAPFCGLLGVQLTGEATRSDVGTADTTSGVGLA